MLLVMFMRHSCWVLYNNITFTSIIVLKLHYSYEFHILPTTTFNFLQSASGYIAPKFIHFYLHIFQMKHFDICSACSHHLSFLLCFVIILNTINDTRHRYFILFFLAHHKMNLFWIQHYKLIFFL